MFSVFKNAKLGKIVESGGKATCLSLKLSLNVMPYPGSIGVDGKCNSGYNYQDG